MWRGGKLCGGSKDFRKFHSDSGGGEVWGSKQILLIDRTPIRNPVSIYKVPVRYPLVVHTRNPCIRGIYSSSPFYKYINSLGHMVWSIEKVDKKPPKGRSTIIGKPTAEHR